MAKIYEERVLNRSFKDSDCWDLENKLVNLIIKDLWGKYD